MDIVDTNSQFLDAGDGTPFDATQVSATQLDCLDFDMPAVAEPVETGPQPFIRLLSLSVGVPHIELRPNGTVVDGLANKHTFGRSKKKCDYLFDDQRISSMHCWVYTQDIPVGGGVSTIVYIVDQSANGSFVNGRRLGRGVRHALCDGDELSLIKPEERVDLSLWDKARFIVKLPAPPVEPMSVAGVLSAEGAALRKRLGTISRLLQQERLLQSHYQIIRPIGEGAHGQVHLAIDRTLGKEWAVKFIDIQKASLAAGSAVTTILKEAEIMKNLQHKHIVNLEDVFADGTNIYLVMELLSGGDLFDRVIQKSKYQEHDALELMHQLLDAISYLHSKGIAHRDLKLENIMLVNQQSDVDIKLTDFGLAKTGGKLKTFCGTPNYYSPEVLERRHTIRGEGSYSVAADMWSCGVILYVLLSGEMPWRGHDIDRCIRDAKYSPMIGRKWISISDNAKSLIKGLLRPDPASRLTVTAALAHPWFSSKTVAPSSTAPSTDVISIGKEGRMPFVETDITGSGSAVKTGISTSLDRITIEDPSPGKRAADADSIGTSVKSKKRKLSSSTGRTDSATEADDIAPPKRRTLPRKCRSERVI